MEESESVNRVKPFHEFKNNLICLEETQAIQRTIKDELAKFIKESSSEKERKVNALASGAEEGRDKLR